MNRYERRVRLLAAGLSALAGFVDAIGFISLGGFFVSFMSGNTTRLAVGLAEGAQAAAMAASLIAAFVAGVMAGTVVRRDGARPAMRVLILIASLLALAALCGTHGFILAAGLAMALAMGAENAIFEREGEVHIGLTYMTGTLVKLGQHLVAAMRGQPSAWRSYLLLWLGLTAGAVAGALVHPWLGLGGLWLAALAAGLFAVIAARMDFTT